jgi:hypothetical protein
VITHHSPQRLRFTAARILPPTGTSEISTVIECAWMFERDVRGVQNLALGSKTCLLSSVISLRHRMPAQLNKSCATSRTLREQRAISMSQSLTPNISS